MLVVSANLCYRSAVSLGRSRAAEPSSTAAAAAAARRLLLLSTSTTRGAHKGFALGTSRGIASKLGYQSQQRRSAMLKAAVASVIGTGAKDANVRIATYNVLSPNLCSPGYFRQCNPEALDPATRLSGVTDQLAVEVEHGAIIGLQEVSLKWAGDLQVWFAKRNYRFIHTNYGGQFNGYMGVGVAYPADKFELLEAELCRLSDTKKWPKKPEEEKGIGGRILGALAPVGNALWTPVRFTKRLILGPPEKGPQDPWEFSMRKFNQFVGLRLRSVSTGVTFWVSTYHMPCAFFLPPAMVIHVAMAVQHIARLAEAHKEPYVLVGDFNIKPGDSTHKLITTGSIESDHPDMPQPREWDSWMPSVPAAMKSAYLEVNGTEPDFTNFAQVKDQEPFIDCLDYIFMSEGCRATEVKDLPKREEVEGPFPTFVEPSDHVLIAAAITIPKTVDPAEYAPSSATEL